jgi:PPOX class probable F420-dependent enzyme
VDEAGLRLETEHIGWLTTVSPAGLPQSSPVWFLWHDGAVLVASRPSAGKVANLARNPSAAFHLEGAGPGDLVVVLEGTATVGGTMPDGYARKYADGLERLGAMAAGYLADFSAVVRVAPSRRRVFRSI